MHLLFGDPPPQGERWQAFTRAMRGAGRPPAVATTGSSFPTARTRALPEALSTWVRLNGGVEVTSLWRALPTGGLACSGLSGEPSARDLPLEDPSGDVTVACSPGEHPSCSSELGFFKNITHFFQNFLFFFFRIFLNFILF
jgi:hypothetical protein